MNEMTFKTRINGEQFYDLLCALGAEPQRTDVGFRVCTGDYWDAVGIMEDVESDYRMEDFDYDRLKRAIEATGKSVSLLLQWMKAVYLLHERTGIWMNFSILNFEP